MSLIYHNEKEVSDYRITLEDSIFYDLGYTGIPSGIVEYFYETRREVSGGADFIDVGPEKKFMLGEEEIYLREHKEIRRFFNEVGYGHPENTIDFINGYNYAKKEVWKTPIVEKMERGYYYDKDLILFPMMDFNVVTNMNGCFAGCENLVTIPLLDTSNVTTMQYLFGDCSNLLSIPKIDTSKVIFMYGTFGHCANLRSVPLLNTSNVQTMLMCFRGCEKLKTIPKLNLSNLVNMSGTFEFCTGLETIPELNTEKVQNFSYCFSGCISLRRVEGISFKSATNLHSLFDDIEDTEWWRCKNLRYMLIKDLGTMPEVTGIAFYKAPVWGINDTLNPDARQSLIDSLLTYSFDRREAGYDSCMIKLSQDTYNQLTASERVQIESKGYLLTYHVEETKASTYSLLSPRAETTNEERDKFIMGEYITEITD